ncbi:PREDICTED: uncharacterized protein DDB_G0271670-like, partial [Nicrophorus vespilloides]|uniref:Uncharacterized protein DDB_G0271670-like n=1 Tax=Nicrophorus vespilloides TaxID=110193 RepID=A0ABM1MNH0_NICVS
EAYRRWLCSSLVPHMTETGQRVRPCLSVCQSVEQKCPYMLPGDRAPAYPTQYAGEPTFLCLDPNIPETGAQRKKSSTGDEDCCYSHCGTPGRGVGGCEGPNIIVNCPAGRPATNDTPEPVPCTDGLNFGVSSCSGGGPKQPSSSSSPSSEAAAAASSTSSTSSASSSSASISSTSSSSSLLGGSSSRSSSISSSSSSTKPRRTLLNKVSLLWTAWILFITINTLDYLINLLALCAKCVRTTLTRIKTKWRPWS